MAYPEINFYSLLEGDDVDEDPEKMAKCIQAIVDLLSEEILKFDMNHIRGEEIVNGNPEHCINLLQILQQISSASMMQEDDDDEDEDDGKEGELEELKNRGKSGQTSSQNMSPGKNGSSSSPDAMGSKQGESAGNKKVPKQGDSNKHKEGQGGSGRAGANDLFGGLDDGNEHGENKQQFLDNFDDFIDINDINMENVMVQAKRDWEARRI